MENTLKEKSGIKMYNKNLENDDLLEMSHSQLKQIAKDLKVKFYYNMKKQELRDSIRAKRTNTVEDKPIIKRNDNIITKNEIQGLDEFIDKHTKIKYNNSKSEIIIKSKNLETFKEQLVKKYKQLMSQLLYKRFSENVKKNKEEYANIYSSDRIHVVNSSSLKKTFERYVVKGQDVHDNENYMYDEFFVRNKLKMIQFLKEHRGNKITMRIEYEIEKEVVIEGQTYIDTSRTYNTSRAISNFQNSDVEVIYNNMKNDLLHQIEELKAKGSGWRVNGIISCKLDVATLNPIKGKSYIKLPKYLLDKKAIINMKNNDNECFKWCITRAMNLQERNNETITNLLKIQSEKYNWTNIKFPMELNKIDKFEKQNENISVNVFGYDEKEKIYPLRISSTNKREHEINLLLISEIENDIETNNHYCIINNMSRLLTSQLSNHNGKKYFCYNCLSSFSCEEKLENHKEYCNTQSAKIIMPDETNNTLEFKNYCKKMEVPFVVYADFESFIKKIEDNDYKINKKTNSYTKKINKHIPCSFNYYIKCFDESVYNKEPVKYTSQYEDDDVAQKFIESLEKDIKEIFDKFGKPKEMIMTEESEHNYLNATECHICNKKLEGEVVRDHCHITGKYRGAAHKNCNLNYKLPKFIPVLFHNLSGYDSHLFIKKLRCEGKENLNCIPTNDEKYISFSKKIKVGEYIKNGETKEIMREIRFLDSLRFMNSSLDKLSGYLIYEDENKNKKYDKFKNIKKYYSEEQLPLITKKGIYPYEYMNSFEKFEETILPKRNNFYSSITNKHITRDEYKHAINVWNKFKIKNMREYTDLYNKVDVLLLADVFENFREICYETYGLDPLWYYTAPGLAFDAALKITNVKLELLTDYDMLLFIKNGIRGGISMISKRYSKANNKYMLDKYDEEKESVYIKYLDANNLYGWAMCQDLPVNGFKWMNEEELNNWSELSKTKGKGCILEVDLEYPEELHNLHNEYPLAPERIKFGNVEKLIPNLNNKTKYIIHYKNLELYKSLGLKITKIHKGVIFNEEEWLKPYIELNTKKRQEAAKANNEFGKDFYKLMNNAVYGKTMENIEKRIDLKLVTDAEKARKLIAKPNYNRCKIFDENLTAIHMNKIKIEYNKPIYLGFCILELSKTLMYDFHYNYIKNKYNDKVELLFTDTDSLVYEIHTEDFYKDIENDIIDKFDTSDLPEDHPSNLPLVNSKIMGMFKDEKEGFEILEFVGLLAKLYSLKVLQMYKEYNGYGKKVKDGMTIEKYEKLWNEYEETKKCKGVSMSVVKKSISHEDYLKCLNTRTKHLTKMNVFRSRKHEMYNEEVNKIALSANDDKRYILEDGIKTLAHGHHLIPK